MNLNIDIRKKNKALLIGKFNGLARDFKYNGGVYYTISSIRRMPTRDVSRFKIEKSQGQGKTGFGEKGSQGSFLLHPTSRRTSQSK